MAKDSMATVWDLEDHTRAKHQLLMGYLDAWYPIMSKYKNRIVFLDGFAGPGVYSKGEPGSPILALRRLLEHQAFDSMGACEFVFFFIEHDKARHTVLAQELDKLEATLTGGRWPKNVKVNTMNTTFVDAATSLLTVLQSQQKNLAPTFAFIDPFGFSGGPMSVIRDLLSYRSCELMFNFMYDWINRFVTAGNVDPHFEELFGCKEFKGAPPAGDPARHDYLISLYKSQLQTMAGFQFVRDFELVTDRGKTGMHLMFGTRNRLGLEKMKHAMWKVDPEQGRRFDARNDPNAGHLFAAQPDISILERAIETKFKGSSASIEDVERFVLEETDYLPGSHLKTKCLKPMEACGKLTVTTARKKPGSYPERSMLQFI